MAHANEELIERFYAALDRHDAEAMVACYAPDVVFSDPVFPRLSGEQAGDMWRMFAAGSDLRAELVERSADDQAGTGKWVARYTFSQTGRPVENHISSKFRFADGLIVEHTESFDFHRWARQALGPAGAVLGRTPILRNAVRKKAGSALSEFSDGRAEA